MYCAFFIILGYVFIVTSDAVKNGKCGHDPLELGEVSVWLVFISVFGDYNVENKVAPKMWQVTIPVGK